MTNIEDDLSQYLIEDELYTHIPQTVKKPINKLAGYGSTSYDPEQNETPTINIKVNEMTGIWTVSGQLQGVTAIFTGRTKIEAQKKYQDFYNRYTTQGHRTEPDVT
jgi:transposase